jgi:hypothetical protein
VYAPYSFFLQTLYAAKHKYAYFPQLVDSSDGDYAIERKISPLLSVMRGLAAASHWVVWLDADLIVIDLHFQIESIISAHPNAHLILSADISTLANTGFVMARNCPEALVLLESWRARRFHPDASTDQVSIDQDWHRYSPSKFSNKL